MLADGDGYGDGCMEAEAEVEGDELGDVVLDELMFANGRIVQMQIVLLEAGGAAIERRICCLAGLFVLARLREFVGSSATKSLLVLQFLFTFIFTASTPYRPLRSWAFLALAVEFLSHQVPRASFLRYNLLHVVVTAPLHCEQKAGRHKIDVNE
jgi:hypothetical protein